MTARLLWRLVLRDVLSTLEYRATVLIWMINIVIGPLIALLVWLSAS